MLGRSKAVFAMLVLAVAACGQATETMTSTSESPTITTPSTTATAIGEPTTTPAVAVLDDLAWRPNASRSLDAAVLYRATLSGVQVEVTPPDGRWELLGLERSGMLLGWAGPSGFRDETLDVLVFDVGDDGIERAWERIEALLDAELDSAGEKWAWSRTGASAVGGITVEWREGRVPDVPRSADDPRMVDLSSVGRATLWAGTSARVFVVPIEELTVTLVGYETRCACSVQQSWARDSHVDDVENELSMWVPELEDLLESMMFEAP